MASDGMTDAAKAGLPAVSTIHGEAADHARRDVELAEKEPEQWEARVRSALEAHQNVRAFLVPRVFIEQALKEVSKLREQRDLYRDIARLVGE